MHWIELVIAAWMNSEDCTCQMAQRCCAGESVGDARLVKEPSLENISARPKSRHAARIALKHDAGGLASKGI